MDRLFLAFHDEGNVVLEGDQVALEVRDGHAGMGIPDIDADKIARIRIQTVDGRTSAAGSA